MPGGFTMCGRYAILEEEAILEMREIINQVNRNFAGRSGLAAAGEIAPSQTAPVLRGEDGKVRLDVMKWGFPKWDGTTGVIINARTETVLEKRMFRESFQTRRIVIPSSGFYEWDHRQPGHRDKYFFTLPGQVVYMAGFFNLFPSDSDACEKQERFVIMTIPAVEPVAGFHDRMPLIMPKSFIRTWLDPRAETALLLNLPAPSLTKALCVKV
jgi:putative SOS response-associated peptidase YedK